MTIDENVLLAEQSAKKTARDTFQQLQVIRFLDKKVSAIGDALIATRSLIQGVHANDEVMTLYETIQTRQHEITESLQQIADVCDNMKLTQDVEALSLTRIKTTHQSNIEKVVSYNVDIQTAISQSHDNYINDLESLKAQLIEVSDALGQLVVYKDIVATYEELVRKIDEKAISVNKSAIANRQVVGKQLKSIRNLAQNNAKLIGIYRSILLSLTDSVNAMTNILNIIQQELNSVTPKSMDMSSSQILSMFSTLPAITDSHVVDISEIDDVVDVTKHELQPINTPVEPKKKKHKWWKRK